MNANPDFLNSEAQIDQASTSSLPNSRKVYAAGSANDIRVPMREVRQSSTAGVDGDEENPPIFIYDTSGPYTDPEVKVNIQEGLPELRKRWIESREDTETLNGPTSEYGTLRLNDPELAALRFKLHRQPRRAHAGKNVTQMHYARRGIVTPEMEFVAIRENLQREKYLARLSESQRALIGKHQSRICAARSCSWEGYHSRQHQSPRNGTNDHWSQFSCENQRQYWKFRSFIGNTRRS